MRNGLWKKGLVVVSVFLFFGTTIVPVMSCHSLQYNGLNRSTSANQKAENPSVSTRQFKLITLLVSINGTGETSTALAEMTDGFTLVLSFAFINAEAELKWGFLGLPLWEWFPVVFHPEGPHRFRAIGFWGTVQKIDGGYHIEGYCLGFEVGRLI